ncbi:hypothetical protein BT69DRAFT_1276190 [Atractiella rhizophila]|nr:hypothetical protein BT69DRAFT_1276190 [Atractiella rhizophila]
MSRQEGITQREDQPYVNISIRLHAYFPVSIALYRLWECPILRALIMRARDCSHQLGQGKPQEQPFRSDCAEFAQQTNIVTR